jgi:hypothetical protein
MAVPPLYQKSRGGEPTSVVGWLCPLCTGRLGKWYLPLWWDGCAPSVPEDQRSGTYLWGWMAVPLCTRSPGEGDLPLWWDGCAPSVPEVQGRGTYLCGGMAVPPLYQKTREVVPTSVVGWLCPLCNRRPKKWDLPLGLDGCAPLYQKSRGGGPTSVVGWLCPLYTRRPGKWNLPLWWDGCAPSVPEVQGRGTYLCGGMAVPPLFQKNEEVGPTSVVVWLCPLLPDTKEVGHNSEVGWLCPLCTRRPGKWYLHLW